jgi:hypothetical protein
LSIAALISSAPVSALELAPATDAQAMMDAYQATTDSASSAGEKTAPRRYGKGPTQGGGRGGRGCGCG